MRPQRALIMSLAMLFSSVGTGIANRWLPVREGKHHAICGMELLGKTPDGLPMFLVVHDNKQPKEQRVAIITVKGQEVDYFTVGWRGVGNEPADLEALTALPGNRESTFWAMTSAGVVTEFRLVENNTIAEVIRKFRLPGVLPEKNHEALVVKRFKGRTLVVWGSRGIGSIPGVLYWGALEGEQIRQEGWLSHSVPWPEGEHVRHVSDFVLDDSGNLYVSAARDPGDEGPFESAVYSAGRFELKNGRFIFNQDIREVARMPGHKVEGIALLPGEPVRMAFGTDNEKAGSYFYYFGEPLAPNIAKGASEFSKVWVFLVLFSVIFAVLWLKELSQRLAIEAAQHCLGSISDHVVYEECRWASHREVHERKRFAPGWAVVYGSRSGSSGKSLELHVSLAGDVTGSNVAAVSEAISLDAVSRSDKLAAYAREMQDRADAEA